MRPSANDFQPPEERDLSRISVACSPREKGRDGGYHKTVVEEGGGEEVGGDRGKLVYGAVVVPGEMAHSFSVVEEGKGAINLGQ